MKTLNEYMAMRYKMEIIEDPSEGGFVVSFPELPGCLTCGESLEEAVASAKDAQKAWKCPKWTEHIYDESILGGTNV